MNSGLAHSVHARLVREAKKLGVDANFVFSRYGVERLLYRLSRSPYADRFVLKGALLLLVWLHEPLRPTRDADLLGFGDLSADSLQSLFSEVCTLTVEDDALVFDPSSVLRRLHTCSKASIRRETPLGCHLCNVLAPQHADTRRAAHRPISQIRISDRQEFPVGCVPQPMQPEYARAWTC